MADLNRYQTVLLDNEGEPISAAFYAPTREHADALGSSWVRAGAGTYTVQEVEPMRNEKDQRVIDGCSE